MCTCTCVSVCVCTSLTDVPAVCETCADIKSGVTAHKYSKKKACLLENIKMLYSRCIVLNEEKRHHAAQRYARNRMSPILR